MKWSDAHIELLRRLHATKETFSQIAWSINRTFGTSFTRNAAIGQAGRLHLEARAPAGNQSARAKRIKPRVRKSYVPRPQTFEPSQIPTAFTVTLMDLEPWMCRYVEGDGPFYYCGQPAAENTSYCALHHEVCHVCSNYQRVRDTTGSPLPGGS
jgi:hypothetical protein